MNITVLPSLATEVASLSIDVSTLQGQVATMQAAPGNVAIYQPGGTTSGNTYAGASGLYNALAAVKARGPGLVVIDGTMGMPITEARAYDWENVALGLALWVGGNFALDIVEGTTFVNLESVVNSLWLNNKATATPIMTISASLEFHLVTASAIISDAACTAPFFRVLNGATMLLHEEGYALLDGQGAHAVLRAEAGSAVNIYAGAGAAIGADTLVGDGTIQVTRGVTVGILPYYYADINSTQTGANSFAMVPA